jgi:hypothetical protein
MSKSVRQLSLGTVGGRLGDDCSTGGERALGSENLNRQIFGKYLVPGSRTFDRGQATGVARFEAKNRTGGRKVSGGLGA